ncbi:MAG: cytotoxic translational repressor of toxin-antitoxin stability system [Opitutales bacterium]|nr:cytotoxic translational repressor of toxin-antitoxin stability system [Opitutales bacterium]
MNQISFTPYANGELKKLPDSKQMQVVEALTEIKQSALDGKAHRGVYGVIRRDGKFFYRMRLDDLRLYFTLHDQILFCTHILKANSITDFAFRNKLPVKDEHLVEQDKNFWDYLDSLNR